MIFAGSGTGRTGSRTFESPAWDSWGPRAGFAYRLNDKTMVRGGYGMYYAGVAFSQYAWMELTKSTLRHTSLSVACVRRWGTAARPRSTR